MQEDRRRKGVSPGPADAPGPAVLTLLSLWSPFCGEVHEEGVLWGHGPLVVSFWPGDGFLWDTSRETLSSLRRLVSGPPLLWTFSVSWPVYVVGRKWSVTLNEALHPSVPQFPHSERRTTMLFAL